MKDIIYPDGFTLEFIRKQHPRKHFVSGEPAVDAWLQTKALQNADKRLTSTTLLLDPDRQIAGFYSLASKAIDFSDLPEDATHHLPQRPLPVAVVAWLGIDQKYQGQGLGKRLFAKALTDCFMASSSLPFVAVVLDCLTQEAKEFYQHWQFEEMPEQPMRLFLSYARLEAMLES